MIHIFHVNEEKMQKSLFFCKCKQTFKAEKAWEFIDKDRAEVSGVSDQVSYLTLSKRNWLFQMRKNKVDGRTRLLVLAARKIELYVPWCFHCWHGFSICTHLSSWVSFSFFLRTPSTCLQHLPTCFIGWNVNPHWLALKKGNEKLTENYFLTDLVMQAVGFRGCKEFFLPGATFGPTQQLIGALLFKKNKPSPGCSGL